MHRYDNIAIALNSAGTPYIGYICDDLPIGDIIKLATMHPGGWDVQIIDKVDLAYWLSLKIDQQGYPHLAYESSGIIKHAYQQPDGWVVETVVGGYSPSLDLDDSGYPYLSYGQGGSRLLSYAYQDEAGWHFESTGVNDILWHGSSMVLDNNGYPHIAYCEFEEKCKYVYKDNTGWHEEELGYLGSTPPSLAVDQLNHPHISSDIDGNLIYFYKDQAGWHKHIVDDEGTVGWYSSIALDEEGIPHISYQVGGDVKLASLRSPLDESILQPAGSWGYADPGSTISHTLQVFNTGILSDTYTITIGSTNWPTASPDTVGPVEAGYSTTLDIQVTIPLTATLGSSDTATITLTSQNDPSFTTSATLTTYAAITTYLPLVER
jgi:hypothetical protein